MNGRNDNSRHTGTGAFRRGFAAAALALCLVWSALPAFADNCVSGDCRNGFGTLVRDNGNKYVGEFKNGKFHGHGTYSFNEEKWKGDQYTGEFKNGQYHGLGTYSWANGDKYTGDFKNDAPNGHGTYTWGREPWLGDKYVGGFVNWKKEGFGTYYWKEGDKYVGEFSGDASNGEGTYYYANGDVYKGEFKEWKKDGQGEFTWKRKPWTGDRYVGSFQADELSGQGTKYYSSGDKYEGSWENWKRHGFGTYTWKNGNRYIGNWVHGKKDGHGTQYYASGDQYDGEFKEDQFHGQGVYIWGRDPWKGDQYNGEFSKGKLTGFGTKVYASGDKYTGEWKDWKKHGYGTYTWKKGDAYTGEWVDSKMHGQGTFTYANGSRDVGTWENDKPLKVIHYDPGEKKQDKQPPIVVQKPQTVKPMDNSPPIITVTSHEVSRGIVPVPTSPTTHVTGIAQDESGIAEVLVNGQPAQVQSSGEFAATIPINPGKSEIVILARDIHQNTTQKSFWLESRTTTEEQTVIAKKPDVKKSFMEEMGRLDSGDYHAIIIGINDYKHLPKLETAVNDAKEVERVLRQKYGFKTNLLIDVSRTEIMRAFNNARKMMGPNDNILIYYAGHGEFDKTVNKAYWLPADAERDSDANWLIVDNITTNIRRFASRHVLVVADSCYSGTLTRSAITNLSTPDQHKRFLEKMHKRSSRTLMASGGNEPVADGGGGGHSVFARAFIDALHMVEEEIFTAEQLFYKYIKEPVAGRAEQVPEYNIIKNSGHAGGDFVFVKKQ
ncbi:exported hypothetical protein [Nitrospina gracilis 3/211]|uniref:Peptidase C14 caspase domain-containing protein n=1 Tax=Nitrospina gracilis (strain 3/211) TaxID=1266370 RepID=M1YWE1_NITG3|nr:MULTISPECIES: caspase family protein [Nitrospina]MCF8722844.1 hypothetical protein [Nitrospina sp. Nb-3]CCQ89803.1 exported hypothetical protein [Nitrospina gracilis 3/211]